MSRQTNRPEEPVGDAREEIIDALAFSREHRESYGVVPLAALDRLVDVLLETSGSLNYRLQGLGPLQQCDGRLGLALQVSGNVRLRCQRCLQSVDFVLQVESRLQLVVPGEAWPDESVAGDADLADEWDAIEASREQSVLALVEEEVLLGLPIVPRHGMCEPPVAVEQEHEPSPFAVLAKLKQQ